MLNISRAELVDTAAIIQLQRLAYQTEAERYNDWSLPALTQTIESLQAEFTQQIILKAVQGEEIIGSVRASMQQDVCNIGRLIVHPQYQRQGIGSQLLRKVETLHPQARIFELFTGSKSFENIRLYQKHGYAISHSEKLSPEVELVFLRKTKDE
ncbi:GNAT family N-acetyltransferase [Cellvibrio sp. OA-2007]|uniref:GNAT family N-acetyltransferase n=1 Tax=Cellvibrio sp. OA-2007 TaxID=529823 RepID=UPI0007838372|nr:GNAT family N-acetyltransferase [Cellvibrio sp. OA-2007]